MDVATCIRDGKLFQLNPYNLWVYQKDLPPGFADTDTCPISRAFRSPSQYYVYPTSRPYVWYNEDAYFKLITEANLEPYLRLGNHPNFPSLQDHWTVTVDEKSKMMVINGKSKMTVMNSVNEIPDRTPVVMAVMDRLHGVSLKIASLDVGTMAGQYQYYAIVRQTLSAIEHAHSVNLLLFDVASPENVLVDIDRAMMYFIDLDDTAFPLYQRLIPADYLDSKSVVWHLLRLVWADTIEMEIRADVGYDEDEYDYFLPEDYPESMFRFCQRQLTIFGVSHPMQLALQLLMSQLEPFL